MALKDYKVNEAIKVVFQAAGSKTGAVVNMTVFDEAEVSAASVVMSEIGVTGKYQKSFTPDAEGDWQVHIADDQGGKAVKHFSVGPENVGGLAARISAVDSQLVVVDDGVSDIKSHLDVIESAIGTIESPPMIG